MLKLHQEHSFDQNAVNYAVINGAEVVSQCNNTHVFPEWLCWLNHVVLTTGGLAQSVSSTSVNFNHIRFQQFH